MCQGCSLLAARYFGLSLRSFSALFNGLDMIYPLRSLVYVNRETGVSTETL
jgi:hypothetical protein